VKARKLLWTEGLFITQHHLQQLDRYHESLLGGRFQAALPYAWGISELEIDERALTNGQVSVKYVTGFFSNGTQLAGGRGGDDPPPAREIGNAFPANLSNLPVYVAMPHESEAAANVDLEAKPGSPLRFVRQTTRVVDYNTGAGDHEVQVVRPNVRILLGDEQLESYERVQIAELVRTQAGQVMLRDTYVPPVLKIGASPFVMAGCRRVLTALVARQRSLAASRRQRSAAQIDFQASDAAKFWLLNVLNESIPTFSHMVDAGSVSPEFAYLALASVIGKLCTFAVDADPTQIPKYNYLALGDTFEPMFARALSLLDAVIKERYVEIPLQRRDDGMYLGRIEDANLLRYEYFVSASGTLAETELRDRLPRLSKIASWGQIGSLLNSAVNGARIDLEYRPPGALPVKPGVVFFRLQKTPEYWPDIQGTGTIAIYHPLPKESVGLALYAVDPQNL
jgi:type VI secretion system protein ImpJ